MLGDVKTTGTAHQLPWSLPTALGKEGRDCLPHPPTNPTQRLGDQGVSARPT